MGHGRPPVPAEGTLLCPDVVHVTLAMLDIRWTVRRDVVAGSFTGLPGSHGRLLHGGVEVDADVVVACLCGEELEEKNILQIYFRIKLQWDLFERHHRQRHRDRE